MALYLGRNSALGVGLESTWGTAVARTLWFPFASCSILRSAPKAPIGVLMELAGSPVRRQHFVSSDVVKGSVTLIGTYEGLGALLQYLLWATPTTTGPISTIYTHTYLLALNPPTGAGLTLEVARGQDYAGGSAPAEVFEGCMITKGVLKVSVGQLATLDLEFIGETSGGRTTAGTVTLASSRDQHMIYHQAGVVGWNSATFIGKSLEVTVDRKLAERPLLGSKLTAQPAPSDFMDVTVKLDTEYTLETLPTGLTADTVSDLTCTFTGNASRTLAITQHQSYLADVSDPISNYGVISQSATFMGQAGSSDKGIGIVIANTQSTAVAA